MEDIKHEINSFIEEIEATNDDQRIAEVLKVVFSYVIMVKEMGHMPNLEERTLEEVDRLIKGEV